MDRPFPAYQGDEPYIFVSYSHEDSDIVFPGIQRLREQGFNIWYDEGISPGASWREELAESILGCDLFIILVSPQSANSDNCLKEVNYALEHDRPVLAIHQEPTQLSPGLELALSDLQAIFRYELTEEEYRDKVLSGVMAHIQQGQSIDTDSTSSVTNTTTKPILIGAALIAIAIIAGSLLMRPIENISDSEPVIDEKQETATAMPEQLAEQTPAIAVLPFVNMSNDPEQEFFSDGLSEDILNGLANIPGLIVKARTSSFSFKGKNEDIRNIGEQLNVTHILEGSVRKFGNRVRVTAQLIDTRRDAHIWSDQYDRDLVDVFAVQDEITSAILAALDVHFSPVAGVISAPTTNTEAYNAFLAGRYHQNRRELDQAIGAYELAVALDDEYADAHAYLAVVHSLYVWYFQAPLQDKLPIINAHNNKALALNPEHPVALTGQAMNRFFVNHDYQTAINALHNLLEQYPNENGPVTVYSLVIRALGKRESLVALGHRRIFLDPLNPRAHRVLGNALFVALDFDEAESSYRQAERLGLESPQGLFKVAFMKGDFEEAKKQLDRDPSAWGINRDIQVLYRAMVARRTGDTQRLNELFAVIKQAPIYQLPYGRFAVNRLEGNIDTALDQHEDLMDQSVYTAILSARLPDPDLRQEFPEYYTHPRYYDILKQVGLDDEAVAKLVIPPLPF